MMNGARKISFCIGIIFLMLIRAGGFDHRGLGKEVN